VSVSTVVGAPPLVELRGVRAGYGGIEVLHGVDLEVAAGSVTALLGPNGAGKTTTLRVLAGLHPSTDGDIVLAGRRINGARADDLARAGLCLIPEGRGIFPNLSVRENLRVATHTGRSYAEVESETCRAASSRCWRSPVGWRRARGCCCSTSCRWGWPRRS
jgi:branched-chain amino acid transport system ATP-binding protein